MRSMNPVREHYIAVFEENLRLFETDPALKAAVAAARAATEAVPEASPLPAPPAGGAPARVLVSGKRSFQAAACYRDRRVCVLNFASDVTPGGGVKSGSGAQEESLCRCSTLWPCLAADAMWDAYYMPHRCSRDLAGNADCIYSPGVTVFRYDDAALELLPPDARYRVDVLTCAAPDLRAIRRPEEAWLRALLLARARRILALAADRGAEVLILGAFGCGVFRNPPRLVAEAFREALADYAPCFETVEFAVYCPPDRETDNFLAFSEVFA